MNAIKLIMIFSSLISFNLFADQSFLATPQSGSKVGFSIMKFKIGKEVPGQFGQFKANLKTDDAIKTLKQVSATVEVKSINTDHAKRDRHLRSDDFFDVEKYPTMKFELSEPVSLTASTAQIKGKLTIKDVTKEISFTLTNIKTSNAKISFTATAKINRLDFHVSWNKPLAEGLWKKIKGAIAKTVLDDTVEIQLNVQADKK